KHLDRQQGRLGEDRPRTGQFPERLSGPDAVVRRLDPAQSGLKSKLAPIAFDQYLRLLRREVWKVVRGGYRLNVSCISKRCSTCEPRTPWTYQSLHRFCCAPTR